MQTRMLSVTVVEQRKQMAEYMYYNAQIMPGASAPAPRRKPVGSKTASQPQSQQFLFAPAEMSVQASQPKATSGGYYGTNEMGMPMAAVSGQRTAPLFMHQQHHQQQGQTHQLHQPQPPTISPMMSSMLSTQASEQFTAQVPSSQTVNIPGIVLAIASDAVSSAISGKTLATTNINGMGRLEALHAMAQDLPKMEQGIVNSIVPLLENAINLHYAACFEFLTNAEEKKNEEAQMGMNINLSASIGMEVDSDAAVWTKFLDKLTFWRNLPADQVASVLKVPTWDAATSAPSKKVKLWDTLVPHSASFAILLDTYASLRATQGVLSQAGAVLPVGHKSNWTEYEWPRSASESDVSYRAIVQVDLRSAKSTSAYVPADKKQARAGSTSVSFNGIAFGNAHDNRSQMTSVDIGRCLEQESDPVHSLSSNIWSLRADWLPLTPVMISLRHFWRQLFQEMANELLSLRYRENSTGPARAVFKARLQVWDPETLRPVLRRVVKNVLVLLFTTPAPCESIYIQRARTFLSDSKQWSAEDPFSEWTQHREKWLERVEEVHAWRVRIVSEEIAARSAARDSAAQLANQALTAASSASSSSSSSSSSSLSLQQPEQSAEELKHPEQKANTVPPPPKSFSTLAAAATPAENVSIPVSTAVNKETNELLTAMKTDIVKGMQAMCKTIMMSSEQQVAQMNKSQTVLEQACQLQQRTIDVLTSLLQTQQAHHTQLIHLIEQQGRLNDDRSGDLRAVVENAGQCTASTISSACDSIALSLTKAQQPLAEQLRTLVSAINRSRKTATPTTSQPATGAPSAVPYQIPQMPRMPVHTNPQVHQQMPPPPPPPPSSSSSSSASSSAAAAGSHGARATPNFGMSQFPMNMNFQMPIPIQQHHFSSTGFSPQSQ